MSRHRGRVDWRAFLVASVLWFVVTVVAAGAGLPTFGAAGFVVVWMVVARRVWRRSAAGVFPVRVRRLEMGSLDPGDDGRWGRWRSASASFTADTEIDVLLRGALCPVPVSLGGAEVVREDPLVLRVRLLGDGAQLEARDPSVAHRLRAATGR